VVGEMSMGAVRRNEVHGATGVGILCVDHSECEIEHNSVLGTRSAGPDDRSRAGVAIEAHYHATATVAHNRIVASPGGIAAFDQSTIHRDE
jgi:nitrous oxidase accessory protein NosD